MRSLSVLLLCVLFACGDDDSSTRHDAADASDSVDGADATLDVMTRDDTSTSPDADPSDTAADAPSDTTPPPPDTTPPDTTTPRDTTPPPDTTPPRDTTPPPDTAPPPPDPTAENPSCDENHATILRLYQAFFGRRPDVSGGNYWINLYQGGTTIAEIETAFSVSAEFRATYGSLSDDEFITRVYRNVLGRAPDASGRAYWLGLLRSGTPRVDVIRAFSASDEFRRRVPYAPSAFCRFVTARTAGYTRTQIAPNTVWVRSADGDVNAAFIDKSRGSLRVPPVTRTSSPTCPDRSIPTLIKYRTGHFGGTVAINGNWHGCYLASYLGGFSISRGVASGAIGTETRQAYVGESSTGALMMGHYADTGGRIPAGLSEAVSGMTLVVGGARWPQTTTATTDPTYTARLPRTAAAHVLPAGYLILVVVDGRTRGRGMTGTETADLLIRFGATRGIMLDGGGSSAMHLGGRGVVNEPSDGSTRAVANQLLYNAPTAWLE